jgi:hypothetical protein
LQASCRWQPSHAAHSSSLQQQKAGGAPVVIIDVIIKIGFFVVRDHYAKKAGRLDIS